MQSGTMYLNEIELRTRIEELKNERNNMELLFQRIKEDNLGMVNYWTGDTGEESYETVKKYTNRYEKILKKIDSYIKFLENMASAHNIMDTAISNKIEENANISTI